MGAEHRSRNDPMALSIHLMKTLTEEQAEYLRRCAEIRRCSVSRLGRALMRIICEDQMVLAILDDDSRPLPHANLGKVRADNHGSREGSSPETAPAAPNPTRGSLPTDSPVRSPATSVFRDDPLEILFSGRRG